MFSVKRLAEHLNITPDAAKEVRAILQTKLIRGERAVFEADSPEYELLHNSPSRKLYAISRTLYAISRATGNSFYGVEIIRSCDDTPTEFRGISYLNAGDTYSATLLYDHKYNRWILSDYGTVIERGGRRFE